MDLNLFENRKKDNNDNLIEKFLKEIQDVLTCFTEKNKNNFSKDNVLDEYNLFEKKKIFLDNKSRHSNDLAWIVDKNSVCISEHGDGGPYSISEVDLPKNVNSRRSI